MTTVTSFGPSQPAGDLHPLHELTLAVASASAPEEIYEAALDCLAGTLGVERASVLTFDDHGVMRFRAWRGLSDAYRAAVDGHSPWSADTTDAAPVVVGDVCADESLGALRPVIEAEGIRALAFIPLQIGGRLLGKFMLYFAEAHAFTNAELRIAQTVAAHVAFALDHQQHVDSERRYHNLLETLGVAVYTTDAAGRITFYHAEAVALWGRVPAIGEEMWCGSWKLFWPDGSALPHDSCPMATALRERRPVRGLQAIVERPDGTRRDFVPYPTPLFDRAGNLAGAVNVLVDITERMRAEAALEDRERKLTAALGEKEALLRERDETIALYGATQARLTSLIEASRALMRLGAGHEGVREILEIASELLGADGYALWRLDDAHSAWGIALSRGLSGRYVRTSSLPITSLPEGTMEMVAAEDATGDARLVSRHASYRDEGIRSVFVAPISLNGATAGTMVFYFRETHRFTELDLRVGAALAHLASASITASDAFAGSERARAELERVTVDLRSANAAKDEFLGLVSHELKTPLTVIHGNAEVLNRGWDRLPADAREQSLHDLLEEGERLGRIIENLLLLARAEQGRVDDREPLLVVRVVEQVVARHLRRFPDRTITISQDTVPRPVLFPPGYLDLVIDNLLTNAEKYSPADAAIDVEIERTVDEVRVRVLDGGSGIDPEDADRLFEPFFRSKSTAGRASGMGIGLAVCKRLVESEGGRVWARPRASVGSEFGFAVPIMPDADDATHA
jgi:PAS domain S-box-containing protein